MRKAGWATTGPGTARARGAAALLAALLSASPAHAQANMQLWGNLTLDRVASDRVTFELDLEPKLLVAAPEGDPSWWNVDVTPNVEFAAKPWLDLVGELATGYTVQTDDVNSFELTPRAGLRFHLLSRGPMRVLRVRERPPKRRIAIRDFARVESRNLFYLDEGSGTSSTVRFRNRLEFLAPLNTPSLSDDGARYVMADWEWFVPLDDPAERFANKQRIRSGFGYRRDAHWRFEALYIWTRSRNTVEDGFHTSDHAINIRLKHVQ